MPRVPRRIRSTAPQLRFPSHSDASASSGKPATRLPATVADATPAADAQAVRRGHLATGWPLASLIVNVVLITVAA
eukprot:5719668-Pleurochrysis_carterae.AAC.1